MRIKNRTKIYPKIAEKEKMRGSTTSSNLDRESSSAVDRSQRVQRSIYSYHFAEPTWDPLQKLVTTTRSPRWPNTTRDLIFPFHTALLSLSCSPCGDGYWSVVRGAISKEPSHGGGIPRGRGDGDCRLAAAPTGVRPATLLRWWRRLQPAGHGGAEADIFFSLCFFSWQSYIWKSYIYNTI